MFDVLVRAASLILIMVSGFLIKKIGWVRKEDFSIFSKIVLRYTLPCAIITSFNTIAVQSSILIIVVIGIVINLITGITGYFTGLKKGRKEQAFNILNYGSFNIGAFTLPYVSSFLGAQGVVIASLYDVGNTIAAAGINYSMARSLVDDMKKISFGGIIKNMFRSAIFDTYIVMFILRLLNIALPSQITTFTGIVGQSNTFLAMLMIGIAFEIRLDSKTVRKAAFSLIIRYILTTSFALYIFFFTPFSKEIKQVLCIALLSPIAAMTTGFTSDTNGDVATSSLMTSMSILISIVVISILLSAL